MGLSSGDPENSLKDGGIVSLNIPLFPQNPRPALNSNPAFSVDGFPRPQVRIRLLGTPSFY